MGNTSKKLDHTEEISALSKQIGSARDYDGVMTEMFADHEFNKGRMLAWFLMSCAVRDHLPMDQHTLLNHFFWKWMMILEARLPQEKAALQGMKMKWMTTGWNFVKVLEQSEL